METVLIAFAAALAIAVPAIATAWAQSKIGSAGRRRYGRKNQRSAAPL